MEGDLPMYVVLAYDVGTKRVSKVMKTCRKYMVHVQKSVFEGNVTEAKLEKLKKDLQKILHTDEDSVCIYRASNLAYLKKEQIGVTKDNSFIV